MVFLYHENCYDMFSLRCPKFLDKDANLAARLYIFSSIIIIAFLFDFIKKLCYYIMGKYIYNNISNLRAEVPAGKNGFFQYYNKKNFFCQVRNRRFGNRRAVGRAAQFAMNQLSRRLESRRPVAMVGAGPI